MPIKPTNRLIESQNKKKEEKNAPTFIITSVRSGCDNNQHLKAGRNVIKTCRRAHFTLPRKMNFFVGLASVADVFVDSYRNNVHQINILSIFVWFQNYFVQTWQQLCSFCVFSLSWINFAKFLLSVFITINQVFTFMKTISIYRWF